MSKCILSVDAGGTFLKAALVYESGEIVGNSFLSVPVNSKDGTIEEVSASYMNLASQAKEKATAMKLEISGVGVCIPGPFDYEGGICRMKHKYLAIYGIPMRPWFEKVLGDVPVKFIHDSAGFILGATRKPEYSQYKKIGGVMLGTGLGFATMENGIVLKNETGGPAVSIYNVPFMGKTAEEFASRRAVIRIYSEQVKGVRDDIDVYDISVLARQGNKEALHTFELLGQYLGEILHDVLKNGGYEALLLGGAISKSADLYIPSLKNTLVDVEGLKFISVVDDIDNIPIYGASKAILG